MKIEMINSDLINVFISNFYFEDIDIDKKIELVSLIKNLISKIDSRYKLNLNGFYKIKVYPKKQVGIFLHIIKIDDNEFSEGADFRIVVYQNERFFLETENYEKIKNYPNKKYYNQKFYVDIDDIININSLIEFCNIIYGDDVKDILYYGKEVK